jgi:hypothetical protein
MRFGDSIEFAIEAYHEPSGIEWAGFGRMCIEVQGAWIGDIHETHCSLFHAVDRFRVLSTTIQTLWDDAFIGLSDVEIFAALDNALYKVGRRDWERFGRFDFLTNAGEQFDDTKTFIVCRPDGHVHVFYQFRDGRIGSSSCRVDSFRNAARSFVVWLDDQVRTVAPPWFPVEDRLNN